MSDDQRRILREVAARLQAEGWQVLTEVALPETFRGLKPDLLATRADDLLVVEIVCGAADDPPRTQLAQAAAEAGFSYRIYRAAPEGALCASTLVFSDERGSGEATRAALRKLQENRHRETADVALYHVYALATVAAMRLEEIVGFRRPHTLREDLEDFDAADLAQYGYIGQGDAAALDLARTLLDRSGPDVEAGGPLAQEFDSDAQDVLDRLASVTAKIASAIDYATDGRPTRPVETS